MTFFITSSRAKKPFKTLYASLAEKPKRKSKYNNVKTVVDGITFDSKAEAKRYQELKALQCFGEIKNLQIQVPFECKVNGRKICTYKADFVYARDGMKIVEDVKSKATITPMYNLKKKLVAACHNVIIREVLA